ADTAREEGFLAIAAQMEGVLKIEARHEQRYLDLCKNITDDVVFQRGDEFVWVCRNCGHIHTGKEAPKVCPVCAHPQSYFELYSKNY
ncbi:MAG: rubrerythrin family protein, partial [Oscillospiraceae bacterium]